MLSKDEGNYSRKSFRGLVSCLELGVGWGNKGMKED